MRIRRYPAPILLLLACTVPVLTKPLDDFASRAELAKDAIDGEQATADDAIALLRRDEGLLDSLDKARNFLRQKGTADSRSTSKDSKSTSKNAPVDGADGRPHAGPWVETAADRDRQKTKGKTEDETTSGGRKAGPKDDTASDSHDSSMPATNDGVMDDPLHQGPKEGTRGTEGGISEKTREDRLNSLSGKATQKKPSEPKAAPPLPHSEETKLSESTEKAKSSKTSDSSKAEGKAEDKDGSDEWELGGLKRPEDLPTKPHSIPYPGPNSVTKEETTTAKASSPGIDNSLLDSGLIQPLHSFGLSFTMIVFSEIGDKTFLVAALMAMKHPALLVLSAAFPALVTMTILSAVLGHALPTLLPVRFTGFLAAILFLVFGAKLLREGYKMDPDEGVGEEMREVEMELEEKEQLARKYGRRKSAGGSGGDAASAYALESGRGDGGRKARSNSRLPRPESPPSSPDARSPSPSSKSSLTGALAGATNLFSLLFSPVWVQTFAMTFLGEWGDRSQIATIAMAAGQDYWWVTTGALVGHLLCTVIAVLGGRAIAGRVSMRVVTIGGAFAFLAFGVVYLVESMYYR